MADQVLTRDGPVSVPLDYTVPQAGELIPRTVRATVDGTGAASSFYATFQVIAPSGRVMANAISKSIAAGASADVTWFPGSLGDSTSSVFAAGLMAVRVNIVGAQTIPEGVNTTVTWGQAAADTGQPSPFWSNTHPTRVTAPVNGLYLSLANLEWDVLPAVDGPAYTGTYIYENGSASYLYDSNEGEPALGTSYSLSGNHHGLFQLSAGDYLELKAFNFNNGGVNRDLIDLRPVENHYSSWSVILVGVT